jgi:hypothetical protein
MVEVPLISSQVAGPIKPILCYAHISLHCLGTDDSDWSCFESYTIHDPALVLQNHAVNRMATCQSPQLLGIHGGLGMTIDRQIMPTYRLVSLLLLYAIPE